MTRLPVSCVTSCARRSLIFNDMAQDNNKDRLTPKQEMFCQHYVDIGNASEAYRLSYNCANMKPSVVNVKASELLKNGKITVRVNEIMAKRAEETKVDRKRVEEVLMCIVDLDPAEMYYVDEETGKVRLKSPNQMPTRMRKALKKIKNKFGEITYEFNGKTEAAALLAKMNGWEAPTTVNLTGKGELLLAPKKKD